jgi:hypothetical protein
MMIECHRWRFTHALVLIAVMLVVAGCSGSGDNLPREAISGVVTLDGQPLADGMIQFSPPQQGVENTTSGGSPIKGGRFSIDQEKGLVPGLYTVSIFAAGKRAGADPANKGQPGAGGNKGTDVAKELIPARYNSQTELKHEIKKGGSNDNLKFDLKSN